MDRSRVLVIGAGVNGSVCAASLFNAGMDVTLLARSKRLEEIKNEGIVIEDPFNKKRTVSRVPVIDHLDPKDLYDYVLVVIRKNQVAGVLPMLAQNGSPNIVFMGNNLSGPGEYVEILGRPRVMMGAVYAAGKRDGNLIRAMVSRSLAAPFGEIDGRLTPRLKRLLNIFRQAGFKAEASTDIVDFQTTHAVAVALIASLVIKHGCDSYALGRSLDDLMLYAHALREAHQVLHALGRRIIPWTDALMGKLPAFLQVAGLRLMLGSKLGEVGLAWHCSQAPDEMEQLAAELEALVEEAGLPVPAIRKVLGMGALKPELLKIG